MVAIGAKDKMCWPIDAMTSLVGTIERLRRLGGGPERTAIPHFTVPGSMARTVTVSASFGCAELPFNEFLLLSRKIKRTRVSR
jgi:hypothetical protein